MANELSSEAIKELGLKERLVGEQLLKKALSQLLPFLERIDGGVFEVNVLASIRQWIGNAEARSSDQGPERVSGTKGLKMDFPVHALLLHIGKQDRCSKKYLHLCGHVVWVARTLQHAVDIRDPGVGNDNGFLNNRRDVCRRMRSLTDGMLGDLPDIPDFPQVLHARIKAMPVNVGIVGLGTVKRSLERSLAYSLRHRRSPHRDTYPGAPGSKDSSPKTFWESNYNLADPEDPFVDEEVFQLRAESASTAVSQKEIANAGGAPEESVSGMTLLIRNRPIDVRSGESLSLQPYQDRFARRHVVKNQQKVPSGWSRLSLYELQVLIHGVERETQDYPFACMALLISLITGSPIQAVCKAQLYDSAKRVPEKLRPDAVFLILRERVWGRGVLRPSQAKSAKKSWHVYFESTGPIITFPIADELASILVDQLKARPIEQIPHRRGSLFPLKAAEVIESAKKLLARFNAQHGTRFTLLRVQQALFDAICSGEGDRAEAALITGQMPALGEIASLYYHFTPKFRLADVYKRALTRLPVALTFSKSWQSQTSIVGVGSEICPKIEPLKVLVRDLQAAIEFTHRHQTHPDAWVEHHNCFTRYVVMMVLFATGHRAVQDPIPFAEDIDRERGLVVVNDKTGEHEQKDRLVPLVPECLTQLDLYQRHREHILTRLKILRRQPLSVVVPLFFFLSDQFECQSIRPSTMKDQLLDTFELPLNINRHFLRSALGDSGLPGTAIDAFMGHWADGQHPLDRFSTMDPQVFLRQAREAINVHFSGMGWKAYEGLS